MTRLTPLSPVDVAARLKRGALLVDIREPDEFARRHVAGAISRPLSAFEQAHLRIEPEQDVIFTCRTGNRTSAHCARLQASVGGDAWVLEGGVDGWAAAGLPVVEDRKVPLELTRQVQIAAGLLVLTAVLLGFTVSPVLFGLAAFIGAGLTFAGATGWCGMTRLLARMPWNRRAAA